MILTEIDSSTWEMARVRECWNVLECNCGSTRFPLAARKASGLEDRTAFSGRTSRKRRLDETKLCAPSRSLSGANQICILPWPDSRTLFTVQTESSS